MLIACLGWGSLIWNPGELPVCRQWLADGPFLPIEFARRSQDGRITLVLVRGYPLVRSLWTVFCLDTLEEAREALRKRERICRDNARKHIGAWVKGESPSDTDIEGRIAEWAQRFPVDAVVWTNLPPKFDGIEEPLPPSVDQVISYLSELPPSKWNKAEEYVRKAPLQVDTQYRQRIEKEFGWSPWVACPWAP